MTPQPFIYRGRFAAICFDLDGVLIDTMPLHARAWQEALRPFGRHVSRLSIYQWEGEPGAVTARVLLSHGRASPSLKTVMTLLRDKERRFQRLARHIRVAPKWTALLDRLARRGIRLGLVTGTSSREVRRVVPKEILARFQTIVTGDRVRRGKPHPEPYRAALRQLCVSPGRAIVVENAPYGIRSARLTRAGLVVALATSLPKRFLREAHCISPSITRLCALLERLTSPFPHRYNTENRRKR